MAWQDWFIQSLRLSLSVMLSRLGVQAGERTQTQADWCSSVIYCTSTSLQAGADMHVQVLVDKLTGSWSRAWSGIKVGSVCSKNKIEGNRQQGWTGKGTKDLCWWVTDEGSENRGADDWGSKEVKTCEGICRTGQKGKAEEGDREGCDKFNCFKQSFYFNSQCRRCPK